MSVQLQLMDADAYVGAGKLGLDTIVRRSFEQALSSCLFERKRSEIAVAWSTTFSREIEAEVGRTDQALRLPAIAVVAEPNLGEQRFLRSFDIRVSGPARSNGSNLARPASSPDGHHFHRHFRTAAQYFTHPLIDQSKNPMRRSRRKSGC
jgi:hypothetical protein